MAADRGRRPLSGPELAAIFAEVSALGPFFAVETHPVHAGPSAPWQPFSSLIEGPGLRERVLATRAALAAGAAGEVELRVAASVTQLGLAARLLSPVLAAAVLAGVDLDVDPGRVWWQPVLGGPVPLSLPLAVGGAEPLSGPIAALTAATQGICAVSPTVLWGNVASAVNGATTMIVAGRPELTATARAHAAGVLRRPPLNVADPRVGPGFRRTSCCLIYRVNPGRAAAVCGDCILT
jgi:hypothetical protein